MQLLRAANHRRMAWKNGGGETIEIAVHPPGAGLGDFEWRVSMARVAGDGPFSDFPGVDRTLAILDGLGMELDIDGLGHRRLTADTAPLFFPADAHTEARLVDGPITDLNVLTRRGVFTHRMWRPAGLPCEARGRWILLLAVNGASLAVDGRRVRLEHFDALVLEGRATIEGVDDTGPDGMVAVEIDPVS